MEVKVPCDDLEAVGRLAESLGADDRGERTQEDIYFSHPCKDFGQSDEALRLRYSDGRWRITYKGPKVDQLTKTREEIEMDIDPGIENVLLKLGFRRNMVIRKNRRILLLDNVELSLDRVEGLGDFVELEYKGGSVERGKSEILDMMQKLGLKGSERRSYLELLLESQGI